MHTVCPKCRTKWGRKSRASLECVVHVQPKSAANSLVFPSCSLSSASSSAEKHVSLSCILLQPLSWGPSPHLMLLKRILAFSSSAQLTHTRTRTYIHISCTSSPCTLFVQFPDCISLHFRMCVFSLGRTLCLWDFIGVYGLGQIWISNNVLVVVYFSGLTQRGSQQTINLINLSL